nr:zinc transporter zip9 [Quercus suber]
MLVGEEDMNRSGSAIKAACWWQTRFARQSVAHEHEACAAGLHAVVSRSHDNLRLNSSSTRKRTQRDHPTAKMLDGLPMLLLLSLIMGGASFLAGILPLTLSLSARQLRLITALGTGVLVGTSLVVIIPEGIETLYNSGGQDMAARRSSIRAVDVPVLPQLLTWRDTRDTHGFKDATRDVLSIPDVGSNSAKEDFTYTTASPEEMDDMPSDQMPEPDELDDIPPYSDLDDVEYVDQDPHAYVGISIIVGFVLMYLIDTIPRHLATSSRPQRFQISLNNFSLTNRRSSSEPAGDSETPPRSIFAHIPRMSSTTIGLVIHAVADGVALGASSTSTSNLSFIIFLALMIHKAPAAFGLTSVLLKQGLTKHEARAHLIIFSLAAPIGALLTWVAAHLLGYNSSLLGANTSTDFATGVLLLFSGGTFLYVAMHAMQEASADKHDHAANGHADGYAGLPAGMDMYNASTSPKKEGPELVTTLVTVAGMLIPLLTQFGHGH